MPIPDVVTTDFFAFDDSANDYGLQGLGGTVEMGDAVLGLVINQMTTRLRSGRQSAMPPIPK